jgi:hypothetical protein
MVDAAGMRAFGDERVRRHNAGRDPHSCSGGYGWPVRVRDRLCPQAVRLNGRSMRIPDCYFAPEQSCQRSPGGSCLWAKQAPTTTSVGLEHLSEARPALFPRVGHGNTNLCPGRYSVNVSVGASPISTQRPGQSDDQARHRLIAQRQHDPKPRPRQLRAEQDRRTTIQRQAFAVIPPQPRRRLL